MNKTKRNIMKFLTAIDGINGIYYGEKDYQK